MAFLENYAGDVTAAYTATQYYNGQTPRVGDWYFDHVRNAKFVFLRNSGSASIAAKNVAVSLTTNRALAPTSGTAASPSATPACIQAAGSTNNQAFAGCRVSGATSLAQNEFGWFQISGPATLTADAAGSTADSVVVTSNATAGAVEAISSTYAVAMGPGTMIGLARTTTTGGDVAVDITSNCWGY